MVGVLEDGSFASCSVIWPGLESDILIVWRVRRMFGWLGIVRFVVVSGEEWFILWYEESKGEKSRSRKIIKRVVGSTYHDVCTHSPLRSFLSVPP